MQKRNRKLQHIWTALQRHGFKFFRQKLGILHPKCLTDKERIEAAFGDTFFIHLMRKNKLEQAISYVKATQTGLWHKAPDGTELERLSEPQEPFYDALAIAKHHGRATALDEDWNTWFADEKIKPVRIDYDELSSDLQNILGLILGHWGRPSSQFLALPPPWPN